MPAANTSWEPNGADAAAPAFNIKPPDAAIGRAPGATAATMGAAATADGVETRGAGLATGVVPTRPRAAVDTEGGSATGAGCPRSLSSPTEAHADAEADASADAAPGR